MRLLWLFLFILQSYCVFAQVIPSKLITNANGLPSNNVTTLFMDSRQMLWVGTQQGLAIVQDGIVTPVKLINEEPILNAWSIIEDHMHRIWVGTYGHGLFCFDGEKWIRYGKREGLTTNQIRKLQLYKNELWIGTSKSIERLDLRLDVKDSILTVNSEAGIVTSFLIINDSLFYTNNQGVVFSVDSDNPITKLKTSGLLGSFVSRDSILWMGKESYYFMNLSDFPYFNKSNKTNCNTIIWDVKEVNNTLFGAGWGIYESSGGLYQIQMGSCISLNKKYGINAVDIISLAYDSLRNQLFVASKTQGVYQVDLKEKVKLASAFSENEEVVMDVSRLNKKPLFLTDKGIIYGTSQQYTTVGINEFKSFQKASLENLERPFPKREDGFFELEVNTTAKNIVFYHIRKSNNSHWVNTNIGLFQLDEFLQFVDYIPVHTLVFNLDSKGNILEAIPHNGVRIYTNKNEQEAMFFPSSNENNPRSVTDIEEIGDYTFFASVFYGITVFDGEKMISLNETKAFKEKNIRHLEKLGDSLIVASTDFGNVFLLSSTPPFNVVDSIRSDQLYGSNIQFLESNGKTLFIGMLDGINVYSDGRVSFINHEIGIPNDKITSGVFIDSNLIVGTETGSFSVRTKFSKSPLVIEKGLVINQISVNNKPWKDTVYKWFELSDNKIRLPNNENTLSIHFGTNGYKYPNLLHYRYRLNKEDVWSRSFTKPEILLPFLSFGTYEITVEVLDAHTGRTNTLPLIQVIIDSPFYRTWTFYLISIIGMSGIVVLIITQREKYVRKHAEQKAVLMHQLEASKMQALLSQMNPHFIFNAINSIQSFILKQDKEKALLYLSEFSSLIRETLNNSVSNTINLDKEIEYLKRYIIIENLRCGNKVHCEWEIDDSIDLCDVEIPSMILQPFIENVFVHAFSSDIAHQILKIKIWEEVDSLHVLITDNGKGFVAKKLDGKPHGMQLTEQRLALLNASFPCQLTINSELGKGTNIKFVFKYL